MQKGNANEKKIWNGRGVPGTGMASEEENENGKIIEINERNENEIGEINVMNENENGENRGGSLSPSDVESVVRSTTRLTRIVIGATIGWART